LGSNPSFRLTTPGHRAMHGPMSLETKYMHLQKPVPMGHCIDGWRVCWLGGWDKQRLFFVVMLVRLQPHPSASVRPSHNDPMELGKVIDALYDSEINCSVSTFWDGGFTVKLGDEMNGFLAERDCKTSHEAAEYLDQAAREHYPESSYALGKDEWERLNDVRNARH